VAGTFFGIGVGPGSPDLVTIRAARLLRSVPVVAFPAGRDGKPGMAEAIARHFLQPQQQTLPLALPFVQDEAILRSAWQAAALQVYGYLRDGMDVAFVTEGDASFYSTCSYLVRALHERDRELDIEVVPGICSPLAAGAALGLPLTLWSDKLIVLPAVHAIEDIEAALDWADVVGLMKVGRLYRQVWDILRSRDLLATSYAIAWATHPQERVWYDLTTHGDLDLPYFSLLVARRSALPF